jgi:hypothetical protein
MSNQYEVLSPWAEVDPIPLRGISPRLAVLKGKKIGLFCNYKPAARPILTAVEEKLKERFPTCETIWYMQNEMVSIAKMKGEGRARFDEWIKGVDGVIAATGD